MEFLFIWCILGLVGYLIGNGKGMGCLGGILGFLLGPIGWIILLILPGNQKQCSYCRSYINRAAIRCPKC